MTGATTTTVAVQRIFHSCAEAHPWVPNCYKMWVWQFYKTTVTGLGIYAPIFMVSVLLFKRRSVTVKELATKTVPEIFRSATFLGLFGFCFFAGLCTVRNLRKKDFRMNFIINGFLASLAAIMWERKSRRAELGTYMFQQAIESMWRVLEQRGFAKSHKNGDVLLFMGANAVLMYMYQCERDNLRGSAHSMLKFLLKADN